MAGFKIYIVHPDDPDIEAQEFRSLWEAKAWAEALCSSYWIEEAKA